MEEIFLVIFYLNRIISGAGITLMENLLVSAKDQLVALKKIKKKKTKATTNFRKSNGKKFAHPCVKSDDDGDEVMDNDTKDEEQGGDTELDLPKPVVAKASVAIEAAMTLKGHLKRVYDISETKCQQFQPSATASHKEKPSAKFAGVMARMQWMWGPGDLAKLCGGSQASEILVKRQLFRFKQMIETEMIHGIKAGEDTHGKGSHSSHHSSHYPSHSHSTHARQTTEMHVDDEDDDDSDDSDDE